jgi:hypothetical protein
MSISTAPLIPGGPCRVAPIQMNWKRIRRKDHLLSCVLALRARGVWESDQAEGRGASGGGKESASVGY